MIKIRFIIVLAAVSLGGCTQATTYRGPDGEQMVQISCDGAGLTLNACFDKAVEFCPTGFTVVSGGQGSFGNSFWLNGFGAGSMPQVTRSILVRCNKVQ